MAIGPIFKPDPKDPFHKITLRVDGEPDRLLTSFEVCRMIKTLKALETIGEYVTYRAKDKEKSAPEFSCPKP